MDYIRFPSEPPATPRDSDIDYPYDAETLSLYREATGRSPGQDKASWDKWRTDQVTVLVADIRSMVRRTRKSAVLSASVGAEYEHSLRYHRDDRRWVKEDLIDAAFPMNYKSDLATFDTGLSGWMPLRDATTVVPGLWFGRGLDTNEGIEVVRQQIGSALAKTGNFCVFSYAALFEVRDRRESFGDEPPPRGRQRDAVQRREARRRALLPVTGIEPSTPL
jgi:uncharacterized lipoprotein YddW (UPF0748 family)